MGPAAESCSQIWLPRLTKILFLVQQIQIVFDVSDLTLCILLPVADAVPGITSCYDMILNQYSKPSTPVSFYKLVCQPSWAKLLGACERDHRILTKIICTPIQVWLNVNSGGYNVANEAMVSVGVVLKLAKYYVIGLKDGRSKQHSLVHLCIQKHLTQYTRCVTHSQHTQRTFNFCFLLGLPLRRVYECHSVASINVSLHDSVTNILYDTKPSFQIITKILFLVQQIQIIFDVSDLTLCILLPVADTVLGITSRYDMILNQYSKPSTPVSFYKLVCQPSWAELLGACERDHRILTKIICTPIQVWLNVNSGGYNVTNEAMVSVGVVLKTC